MKINLTVFFIIISIFAFSQKTIFQAPKKVIKNSNFMYTIFIDDSIENDNYRNRLHIYIQDAVVDTIYKTDSVLKVDNEYLTIYIGVHKTPFLLVNDFNNIFLVDKTGNLLYKNPLEDIKLSVNLRRIKTDMDPRYDKTKFYDYEKLDSIKMKSLGYDNNIKDTSSLLMIDVDELNRYKSPYIYIKRKGKWGIIDFEGNIIEKPKYFEIKKGVRGIELYKRKGVLDKIIKL